MPRKPKAHESRQMPTPPRYRDVRSREYLLPAEIKALLAAAKVSPRCGTRDYAIVLLGYRHGLRASELVNLRWDQVDLDAAQLHVRRVKDGKPSIHPLEPDELRALRTLRKDTLPSPYLFLSLQGGPLSDGGLRGLVKALGRRAGLPFPIHAHMLRHSCGYALANRGADTRLIQDYLGHRSIQSTVQYTALAPGRFDGLWRE